MLVLPPLVHARAARSPGHRAELRLMIAERWGVEKLLSSFNQDYIHSLLDKSVESDVADTVRKATTEALSG